IVLGQILKLDANRKSPLQLRHQIAWLARMKRSGRDEQDVVRADGAVLRHHRAAFNDRQEITLDPLPRNIRTVLLLGSGDFVQFVEEHDSGLLNSLNRLGGDLRLVDELLSFLLEEYLSRIADH